MSRTKRKVLDYDITNHAHLIEVNDTQAKWRKDRINKRKRLVPYVHPKDVNKGKFEVNSLHHDFRKTGHGSKTIVRNANRSMKKSIRQYLKKQILKELTNGS